MEVIEKLDKLIEEKECKPLNNKLTGRYSKLLGKLILFYKLRTRNEESKKWRNTTRSKNVEYGKYRHFK